MALDYNGNRGLRLLSIYERLNKGERVSKRELASYYGVGEKTIQRDIEDIRCYMVETHGCPADATVSYERGSNQYYLARFEREWLSNKEVLAVCKILLESRAFAKNEMKVLVDKMLAQATPTERKIVEGIIRSENAAYVPLQHGKPLLDTLWETSHAIIYHHVLRFMYRRQDGKTRERTVKPLAIIFSEFYFYMIGVQDGRDGDEFRTYRLDRIKSIEETNETFHVPYSEKFRDGEFRKKVQFMYEGELVNLKFRFYGNSVEHVLDRLPTAKADKISDCEYEITAEIYSYGVLMWLLSQGSQVDVLEPNTLREEWGAEIKRMANRLSGKKR